jgi:hypothetical protein
VRLRSHLGARLDEQAPALVLPGRVVPLPPEHLGSVRRLLAGERAAVRDLGAGADGVALVGLLLQEGIVVPSAPDR